MNRREAKKKVLDYLAGFIQTYLIYNMSEDLFLDDNYDKELPKEDVDRMIVELELLAEEFIRRSRE
jgi:hypothetical protein